MDAVIVFKSNYYRVFKAPVVAIVLNDPIEGRREGRKEILLVLN